MIQAISSHVADADFDSLNQFDRGRSKKRSGYPIEWENGVLNIIGVNKLSISVLNEYLSKRVLEAFKQCVDSIAASEIVASLTLVSAIGAFCRFVTVTKTQTICIESLAQFHEYCRSHKFGDMILLRPFLLRWFSLGYEELSEEVIDYLNKLSLSGIRRASGSKVRSDNLEEGWYTDQEYDDLVSAIWSDYELNLVSLQNTLILLLGAQYGRRPIQMARLKITDIKQDGETLSVQGKRIEFPGAKEKGGGGFRQGKLEVHPLSDELWALCQLQIQQCKEVWEEHFQQQLTPQQTEQLPLFRPTNNIEEKINTARQYPLSSENIYASEFLHLKPARLSKILGRSEFGSLVISHRTHRPLLTNAYRFRYTRAKQLARMGIPRSALQFWLGHEWNKSLDAYYDDPAERARILDASIGHMMVPLAQAFQGTLVDTMVEGVNGDESNRLQLDGKDDLSVGGCGKHGFCKASVPIPCYSCSKFRPWVYGPHEEVLDRLLERQYAENSLPLVGQGRMLIAPVNIGREIASVRNVIARCEERKKILEIKDE